MARKLQRKTKSTAAMAMATYATLVNELRVTQGALAVLVDEKSRHDENHDRHRIQAWPLIPRGI